MRSFPHNGKTFFIDINDPTRLRYRIDHEAGKLTQAHHKLFDEVGKLINAFLAEQAAQADAPPAPVKPVGPPNRLIREGVQPKPTPAAPGARGA